MEISFLNKKRVGASVSLGVSQRDGARGNAAVATSDSDHGKHLLSEQNI